MEIFYGIIYIGKNTYKHYKNAFFQVFANLILKASFLYFTVYKVTN